MNENEFATGSVPVMVAARIYGKDASWVRAGIISVSYTHLANFLISYAALRKSWPDDRIAV